MRRRSIWWFIVLAGLAMLGQLQVRADSRSDRPARTKMGFELYRDYLMVVRGTIGPLKGLNFLLDTGASPSVLDPRIAEKLHLDTVPAEIAVLTGRVRGGNATAPSLQFGPMRRDNFPVLVEDLSFLEKALPVRIDAIVGLDVLGQGTFLIDYVAREIRFGTSPPMVGSIPLRMKEGLAIVDAMVNQEPVHLLLDTGAPSLILFEDMPLPLKGLKAGSGPPSPQAIGDFERKQVRQINLRLGETEFGHESAFVVHSRKDAGHDFDGLVSPAALGITRVAVDLGQGKLAFTREP